MKCAICAVLLLTMVSALAEEKAAKDPADLAKLRKAYEAKVKAVVDPITTVYLKKLNEMKKAYGAKGDLESAQAVQKEIDSLTTTKPKSAITIIGRWDWGDGNTMELKEDGTAKSSNGETGKWRCIDKKTHRYETSWGNLMVMSSDGTTILLKSPNGRTGTVKRLPI